MKPKSVPGATLARMIVIALAGVTAACDDGPPPPVTFKLTELILPGGGESFGCAINAGGDVAGYGAIGGDKDAAAANMAMLWILNLSDGEHSLLDIAERANLPFAVIRRTAELLETHGLLKPVAGI